GTYYIGGLADYNNAISESNEANNNHNVTQISVVAASSPAQDLTGGSTDHADPGFHFVDPTGHFIIV
ncbi:hypothetical protein JQ621_33580, partial [Bradyrhizobium manausense]|uniref:hypothetical protein n=1 Tax=Bradyrhizobium manausense TaxID=989370 RepID=UPI001BA5345B